MHTARLSSKGQLVLPAALRVARAWQPGMRFEVVDTPDGVLLKPLNPAGFFEPTRVEDVFGIAHSDGPVRSVEEMDAAVLAAAARLR